MPIPPSTARAVEPPARADHEALSTPLLRQTDGPSSPSSVGSVAGGQWAGAATDLRAARPPPGYPQVTLQPGSAALLMPNVAALPGATDDHDGQRGFGQVLGQPLEHLGDWVDERTDRLQLWFGNQLRGAQRTCLSLACCAGGTLTFCTVAIWWGLALSQGWRSPMNPRGQVHPIAGYALLLGCVLPPAIPLSGAAVGLHFGRQLGQLLIPDRIYVPDVEAPVHH